MASSGAVEVVVHFTTTGIAFKVVCKTAAERVG